MKRHRRFEPTVTLTRLEADGHVGAARVFRRTEDRLSSRGTTALIGSDPTADLRIESAPPWVAEVFVRDGVLAVLSPAGDRTALNILDSAEVRAVTGPVEVLSGTDLLIRGEMWRLEWEV